MSQELQENEIKNDAVFELFNETAKRVEQKLADLQERTFNRGMALIDFAKTMNKTLKDLEQKDLEDEKELIESTKPEQSEDEIESEDTDQSSPSVSMYQAQ